MTASHPYTVVVRRSDGTTGTHTFQWIVQANAFYHEMRKHGLDVELWANGRKVWGT